MTKPKRAINVGDRISWVNGSFVGFGTVKEVLSEKCFVVSDKHEEDNVVHRRQILKVIRKKKKRELRVVFETQWGADGLNKCLHFSEDSAKSFMQTERPGVQYKLVKFREVLE